MLTEKSQNLLNIFFQKSAGYHNLMSAASAFQTKIRSGTQDLPFLASTGMLLFQSHHVSHIDVHFSILQSKPLLSTLLRHAETDFQTILVSASTGYLHMPALQIPHQEILQHPQEFPEQIVGPHSQH